MIYISNVGTTISNHSYLGLLKFGNPFPLLLNVPQIWKLGSVFFEQIEVGNLVFNWIDPL